MIHTSRKAHVLLLLAASLLLVACGDDAAKEQPGVANPEDSEAPLSDLDSLLEGAPDSSKLPSEAKADETFPAQFDLVASQSPVKSQGGRGVCSIFSTTALMEHLYIKEGTLQDPDFSEQYMQWSAKFQVGRFQNTSGSNASTNLDAASLYGIVSEEAWPYETYAWGASHNPDCAKDEGDRPTECFTNGAPPESALSAKKWYLPRGRWVSSSARSIKAVMRNKQTAVVSGMTFFYQSWNHRRSQLPVNSEYWSQGYILPPNDKDREISLEKRAGHSILLVGWDDDLEVARVDENGDVMKDANGEPIMEKGFFLFKNSWGTDGFGIKNPHGAGYGWLAYSYVEEFGSSMTADLPSVDLEPEVCDDGIDNNHDRRMDCDDPQCANTEICGGGGENTGGELSNTSPVSIPDNDPAGATSTIEVAQEGFAEKVEVHVDIEHTFIGDLVVTLITPDGAEIVLHNKEGATQDNLKHSYAPAEAVGSSVQGLWTLKVVDTGSQDVGKINGWSLDLTLGEAAPIEICDDNQDNVGNGLVDCADPGCAGVAACESADSLRALRELGRDIPDNDPAGLTDTVTIATGGKIAEVTLDVDITHSYIGDLTVALSHPDGTLVVLHDGDGLGQDDLVRQYTLDDFKDKDALGDWTLSVFDNAAQDTGVLNSWSLEIHLQ